MKISQKTSQVIYVKKLPRISGEVFLLYDRALEKKSPLLRKWITRCPIRYGVSSGEALKAIENFPAHIQKITKLSQTLSSRQMTFVVLGGGTLGDFGGFVASVFKRGVKLIHLPSTWLAAIDSSHGGKTALNVAGIKNQIGTFYPAEKIYLVQEILKAQPEIRAHEAFAEIYKVALMQGGVFWKKFSKIQANSRQLWQFLPLAVRAKYQIVKCDPLEISGHRHLLNFGHTMGHVFESLFEIPHGMAVNYGIRFALDWSAHLEIMSARTRGEIEKCSASGFLLSAAADGFLKETYHKKMRELLLSDKKKITQQKIRYIFCERPGLFHVREVTLDQIMSEISRQSRNNL